MHMRNSRHWFPLLCVDVDGNSALRNPWNEGQLLSWVNSPVWPRCLMVPVPVLLVEAKVIPGESPPATGPMAPAMRALVTAGAGKKRRWIFGIWMQHIRHIGNHWEHIGDMGNQKDEVGTILQISLSWTRLALRTAADCWGQEQHRMKPWEFGTTPSRENYGELSTS